jgi:hypothetical protein
VFEGQGDAVVDVEWWPAPVLVRITGNAAGRHFAVTSYDAVGEQIDLLVNTTDPYKGVRPVFVDAEMPARFEVNAADAWTIEVLPLTRELINSRVIEVPGEFSGAGDDVVFLQGIPDTATISGNAEGRHFAVIGYGEYRELLINTSDPYEGTVILSADMVALEFTAKGAWTVAVKGR